MKTFIIDWGEDCNGGRYGLVQPSNIKQAFWEADMIGGPFQIAELILESTCTDEPGYMEFNIPDKSYVPTDIDKMFQFKTSGSLL